MVAKIYVEVGQKVKKGEPLIKMDDADVTSRLATAHSSLSSAEATAHDVAQGGSQDERIALEGDLNRAQLQRQQAEKDLAALKQLQQKGAASAGEVASAEQRLQSANTTLENVRLRQKDRYSTTDRSKVQAQLNDARAAVAAAESSYAGANIRAPLPGTVYSIPVSQYDFVTAGEDLMDVADLNRIQVRAYFDEPEIGKLAVGQAVKIVWDAKPNQTWHGHISRAPSTVITYGTRAQRSARSAAHRRRKRLCLSRGAGQVDSYSGEDRGLQPYACRDYERVDRKGYGRSECNKQS